MEVSRNMIRYALIRVLSILALIMVSAGLSAKEDADPWESMNRKTFAFNEFIDSCCLKPIAKGYRAVTPDFLEDGFSNFFGNATEVLTIVNDLAQGKFAQGGQDTLRFIVNSTVGIAGFIDIGSRIGLEEHDEDFGQTLAVWGVGEGPFVMLPFFGPKTLLGSATLYPDSAMTMLSTIDKESTKYGLGGLSVVVLRAGLLDLEKLAAGDRYTFIRDAYLQRRAFLVSDGQLSDEELFGDDEFDDEDF